METMKAVRFHTYGGPEVLVYEDAPLPKPGPEDILVRVHAAGVNPVDWKIREKHLSKMLHHTLPLIPGWDFSGVVEAAGSGAGEWKKGDEVYARPDIARDGAYAEYIAVRASEVARKPRSLEHTDAAAMPLAALTAWQALFDAAGLEAGQRVLIHAAAGGVGGFAVQLAKWRGAYVIGTASERNCEYVRGLDADVVVDYEKTPFEEVVSDVDVVFDTMGGDTQERSWKTLKKGGILISIVSPPNAETAASHNVRQAFVFVLPNAGQLTQLAGLADSGVLNVTVDTVLPLSEARQAQELSKAGHTRGKIVLKVV
jgi:NADPH:quinone reductase-like Zn-dependent oxidoreductase